MIKYLNLVDICSTNNGRCWFEIKNASGKVVVDSRNDYLLNNGVFDNCKEASVSAVDFLFRNRYAYDNADSMNKFHSETVLKYNKIVQYCYEKLKEIYLDIKSDEYNNRDRTVPVLKSFVETYAKEGGEIDSLIKEIEKDVNGNKNDKNLLDIKSIKNKMSSILDYISRNYDKLIGTTNKIKKASSNVVDSFQVGNMDFFNELMSHYVDKSCFSVGMSDPKIIGVDELDNVYNIYVVDKDRKAIVHVGFDGVFMGLTESKGVTPFSYSYYTDVMVPCLLSVGHIKPIDIGEFILTSTKDSSFGLDCFNAVSCKDKTKKIIKFYPVGGKNTKSVSYGFEVSDLANKISSYEQDINDIIKNNAERIKASKMVKVIKNGSEYEGMAGSIDPTKMKFRNTYVEFPVSIQMDNGLITDVWMTDDDVEIYAD